MKLNADCIRDILLFLETQPFFESADSGSVTCESVFLEQIETALPAYSNAELYYTIQVLGDGDYLAVVLHSLGDNEMTCEVNFITYQGHELLDKIRDDNRWVSVKNGLSAIRSFSLSAIEAFASGAMSAAITAYSTRHLENQ